MHQPHRWDDSVVAGTYSNGKRIDDCFILSTLNGDSLNIMVFARLFAGFGFTLTFIEDSCIVRHMVKSDVEIYRKNANDSLDFGLSVPCTSYQLTLSQKPSFQNPAMLSGKIDLMSEEYYEKTTMGEHKFKVQITAWFRADAKSRIENED